MSQERLRLDYRQDPTYFETDINAVGATTSTTLRAAPAIPGVNDAWLTKNGTVYGITDITNMVIAVPRSDGGGVNQWQWEIEGRDPNTGNFVLLGTATDTFGASAFINAGVLTGPATEVRGQLVVTAGTTGALVDGDTVTVSTDVDPGGLAMRVSGENTAGTMFFWLSSSGSTYYDIEMTHGGYRHTPVLGSAKYPYYDLETALTASAGGGGTILDITDSETYEPSEDGLRTNIVAFAHLQSSLGQTPTIARGLGARPTREVAGAGGRFWQNNVSAVYFNEAGSDVDPGTWQQPFQTLAVAWAAAVGAGVDCVYGGTGASGTGIFNENVTLNAGQVLEAEYGYVPTINGTITITNGAAEVRGFIVVGTITATNVNEIVYDCTVQGNIFSNNGDMTVHGCDVFGGWWLLEHRTAGLNRTLDIQYNNIHDGAIGLYIVNTGAGIPLGTIAHNVFHTMLSGNATGFYTDNDFTGTFEHNSFYNCDDSVGTNPGGGDGIYILLAGGWTATIDNCIFHTFARYCIEGSAAGTTGDYNTFYGWGAGAATLNYANPGGNDQNANPLFTDETQLRFGLRCDSPCFKYSVLVEDTGPLRRIWRPHSNGLHTDGIIFDAQNTYFVGISTDTFITQDFTWCTVINTEGIAFDLYGTVATNHDVLNDAIYDCGSGIRESYSGNTIDECLIYDIRRHGIYAEQPDHIITHTSVWNCEWGLYTTSTAGDITVRDCIFSFCGLYVIYAQTSIVVTYCCVDGTVNTSVNISSATNVLADPLFVNIEDDLEDFHLRTIEGGFRFESAAKDAASDAYDMGCYLLTRGVTDWTWDSYELEHESLSLKEQVIVKNVSKFTNALGDQKLSATSHRRRFALSWTGASAMDEPEDGYNRDRKTLEYIASLIQTDENDLQSNQGLIRLHLRPREYVYPGTEFDVCDTTIEHGTAETGTIDADDATIYTAGGTFVPNEHKGYHASLRWYESLIGVVNAAAETVAVAGAGWVVNEWAGYWIRQGIYYFYILSNTANTLTVSDPFGRLVDVAANFHFYIESYHKVLRNDDMYHYLDDSEGQLLDGDYDWFIDFLVCRLARSDVDILRNMDSRVDMTGDAAPNRIELEEAGLCP